MKKTIFSIILLAQCCVMSAQDTLWVRYDNRFKRNESAPLTNADSIRVKTMQTFIYYSNPTSVRTLTPTPGKSTMMYLLDRLYDLPEENGTISIGGTDIRKIRLE